MAARARRQSPGIRRLGCVRQREEGGLARSSARGRGPPLRRWLLKLHLARYNFAKAEMRSLLLIALLAFAACSAESSVSKIDSRTFVIESAGIPGGSEAPNRRTAARVCPGGYRVRTRPFIEAPPIEPAKSLAFSRTGRSDASKHRCSENRHEQICSPGSGAARRVHPRARRLHTAGEGHDLASADSADRAGNGAGLVFPRVGFAERPGLCLWGSTDDICEWRIRR